MLSQVNPAMIDELIKYETGRVLSADFISKSCTTRLAGFCLCHLQAWEFRWIEHLMNSSSSLQKLPLLDIVDFTLN
jgi:hypothetical protein